MSSSQGSHSLPLNGLKLAFLQLSMLMIGFSLLVDAVNGFFLAGLGIDPKLSAAFKLVMLLIVLFQIGAYRLMPLAGIFLTLLLLIIGPVFSLVDTYDVSGFFVDFISLLKVLTAFIIFIYCIEVAKRRPDLVLSYGRLCLNFSLLVLLGNIALGVLGFGFSSYGSGEEGDEDNLGIKGFFYAGNEVSGIFIILLSAFLHQAWQKGSILKYVVCVLITCLSGLLIATKAAMLAGLVISVLIPIVNERHRLFNLTWLKVKLSFPVIIMIGVLIVFLPPLLDSTGILDRLMWFYQKKGIIGIILSGRDEFIIEAAAAYQQFANVIDVVFGLGRAGLGEIAKESMEVDPVDLYFWHGIPGIAYFLFLSSAFLFTSYKAMKLSTSTWGPAVFTINVLLIAVSFIAGHIITSGMLGPLWGVINGMAYADYLQQKQMKNNE